MTNLILPQEAVIDEEQIHVTPEARERFSLPQDITSEMISFTGADNSEQRVSVEGIIDYGSAADHGTATSTKMDRRGAVGKKSSLESRKYIPDSLLLHDRNAIIDDMAGSISTERSRSRGSVLGTNVQGCFHRFFLNPSYPLRRQMLLTFGSVSSLTILVVMIVSIIASITTGNAIKEESNTNVGRWVDDFMFTTSRFVAEALSPKIMPNDLIDLMVEIARDRFAGYPTTEDDSLTPFFDTQSQTNIYPLQNNPLPLDWDFRHTPNERGNVNSANAAEHVQDRWPWYSANPRLSTAVAMYGMQGACDPRATDSNAMEYYPNCTDANNDIITGGVVAPNPTNEQVYRKAADLSPFLKALYEYQYIKQLGYYFSNSGAGSSIFFPHYELDSSGSYESIGCEWMRTPNPIDPTLGPIGTDQEISRCHPEGTVVPTREYNPLERAWCRDQALDPSRVHIIGPYIDAWSADKRWLMTTGRAVYDLVTGAFVSCIAVDFFTTHVNKILEEVKVDELGILTLARNDDNGTVVTSPMFDLDAANGTTTIDDPTLETGIDRETFDKIKSIVDFSQTWDPKIASSSYAVTLSDSEDKYVISAYPIPSVPEEYDPSYKPEFFAIFSSPKANGLAPIVDSVNQEVYENVKSLVFFTVIIGVIGIAIVILLIFATSSRFVEPLKWMRSVGDQVVGKFGEELDAGIDYGTKKSLPCSPRTELSSLAQEFNKMVAHFSGEGTAKRMQMNDTEKLNLFDFSDDFAGLYRSRRDSAFPFNYPKTSAASDATEGQSIGQCHLGPNTQLSSKRAPRSAAIGTTDYSGKVHKSPLFLWIIASIVTPVLVTTVVISAVVLWQISNQLPSLILPVEEEYFALRESYRFTKTNILSIKASGVAERAARDTHLLTRFSSWLYFGGMGMSGSFTELFQGGAEECKTAPSDSECEWTKDFPCDCKWNDFSVRGTDTCRAYPSGSRRLQKLFFESQSQDITWPDGSRYSTTFPEVATSPNTTAWWHNISALPRSSEESVSNYGTTFARAKIISALSTVIVPLYNYDKSNDKPLAMYIGFEADGMLAGYSGCDSSFATFPFWRSTEENGAALLRPELCPLDKYGFDARCRGWYDDGKSKAKASNVTLHVTAPYIFYDGSVVGQSITSPLIDPRNKKYIGQVLVDFLPNSILKALESDNTKLADGGFPIMITPESDVLGHDTVVGPGYSLNEGGKAIEDLLLPDDAFKPILQNMKDGKRGIGIFSSTIGNIREQINITYAPVVVRSYRPLNSSDIASGVEQQHLTVFSLAFLDSDDAIAKTFQGINDFSSKTVNICIGVLSALVVISTMLIVYIAFRVTTSMTEPILQLLDVMKDINCMRISNDDITKLSNYNGSCREVDSVYKTMEMLYKVMQFANSAFFSGDLEVAYQVLRDAVRLFTRLDNKKAIAVASNNLGNTMLTIYRTMKATRCEEMCGLSKRDVIAKGTAYFAHSIKLGEAAYDQFYNEQGWSEECLVFMQLLANRYFNRAIFFLTTSFFTGCDSENRKEAESLGFRDLQITADMDVEIVDQCLEMGFKINRVERYELMMSRVRGLLALVELGYSPDELFIEDRINEVYQDLKNAMKNPSHELFKEISAAGRMQKLDTELIKYFSQAKKDNNNAARVAIRMLIEDEYVFPDAEEKATKMLLAYINTTEDENCPKDENGDIVKQLESEIETLEHDYVQLVQRSQSSFNDSTGRATRMRSLNISVIPNVSKGNISDRLVGGKEELPREKSERRSSAVRESCRGDVTMELF